MKAIDQHSFWKERIDNADREHYSVFICSDDEWNRIGQIHKDIIQKETSGKVLDAGCGYGRASEWVEDYTGVDFSPDFIELAKSKYPNKTFIQASLKGLPFKDNEFDFAFCISMKAMVVGQMGEKEWDLMEKELKRVAKKLLILEYGNPEQYWII